MKYTNLGIEGEEPHGEHAHPPDIRCRVVPLEKKRKKNEKQIKDEKLGMKSSSNTSIPFRIAFNSLLNKKLINHY